MSSTEKEEEKELLRWFQDNPNESLEAAAPFFKKWCETSLPDFNTLSWTASGYSYDRSLVERVDPFFDIQALRWAPGAKAPYHDHAARGCLQVVVNGELHERRLVTAGEPAVRSTLTPATSPSFISNSLGVHSISNPTQYVVMSLHLYAPCKHKTTFFD